MDDGSMEGQIGTTTNPKDTFVAIGLRIASNSKHTLRVWLPTPASRPVSDG
jgi:hypothetical protein